MKALEAICVLIGGLLIGYSIGAYSRQSPYPVEFNEENEAPKPEVLEEEPKETEEPRQAANDQTIFEKTLKEENYTSYSKMASEYSGEVEDEEESDDEDELYEIEELQEESTEEPYSISEEEFNADVHGYTQESWTYYIDDMLIADSYGNPVGIPEMFVGNAFDIMRNALDGTIMHWRAPQSRLEIELVASRDPYSDTYLPKREELQRQVAEQRKKGGGQ